MTRLLFWTESFWPYVGGVEVLGTKLVLALRRRGYQIAIVTSHGSLTLPDDDLYEGVPVHRLPFHHAFAQRDITRLAEIHHRLVRLKGTFTPDLVHMHHVGPSAVLYRQVFADGSTPLLVTLLSMIPDQLLRKGSGFASVVGSADWVTANALTPLDQARRHLPDVVPRSSVVYNGLDRPTIARAPLPFDPPRLLCVGRLSPEKGFDVGLSAFAMLSRRFPAARLIVAGDGSERTALERQAADSGIADVVDFVGWVAPEKVRALMNQATTVVIPSWTEGLPVVATEAGQMGRPIVATRVGGIPEVVLHGETGLLAEPGDSNGLAAALAALIEDPERARRMGEVAYHRAHDVFTIERCVESYDALYRRLIEEHAGVAPA
jgi:glycosyltransferase involved in cell wall biosynthesis